MDRHTPRFAILTPYAALSMLKLLHSAGIDSAEVRRQELFIRRIDPGRADQFVQGWRQMQAAADDYRDRFSTGPVSVPSAVDGSAPADDDIDDASSEPSYVTTEEAARLLDCGSRRVRQLIESGQLPARKVGRTWLVDRGQAVALAEMRRSA